MVAAKKKKAARKTTKKVGRKPSPTKKKVSAKAKKGVAKGKPQAKPHLPKKKAAPKDPKKAKRLSLAAQTLKTQFFSDSQVKRAWHLIDLNNQVLGRAAATIAHMLRGKHKPQYTPHADTGDFVVAINAEKVKLTGRKLQNKIYHRYTGYLGGIKSASAEMLMKKNPRILIHKAVKGMLPNNPLGRRMLKKFKVYAGADHPHAAQKPEAFKLS